MTGIIGDIHGCYNTLRELVNKLRVRYPGIELYSVGDLVDRGRFSSDVIEFIMNENIRFTAGNHDYMFLYYMREPFTTISRAWIHNGYETTLASYDGRREKMADHLDLISRAPFYFDFEDCFISHAGLSKFYSSVLTFDFRSDHKSLDEILRKDIENDEGILWTRNELMNIGRLQIVGHTRRQEIYFSKHNNVLYIDTSAYSGNKLSAVVVENKNILEHISVPTNPEDLYL